MEARRMPFGTSSRCLGTNDESLRRRLRLGLRQCGIPDRSSRFGTAEAVPLRQPNGGHATVSSLLVPLVILAACVAGWSQEPVFNVGRAPTAEEVRAWDISVGPTGTELPPGKGTAREGAPIYAAKCAACHGAKGEGGSAPALVGGRDTLTTIQPLKTVGSYWPFATSIWDYINRAMPRGQPQSLPPDEVYALTALLLHWNEIIPEGGVMDPQSLPKIKMPNRDTFVPPDLKDINRLRCRAGTCP